jgi:hypothetical protein
MAPCLHLRIRELIPLLCQIMLQLTWPLSTPATFRLLMPTAVMMDSNGFEADMDSFFSLLPDPTQAGGNDCRRETACYHSM